MQVQSLGCEDPLEKEKATYSSIPAWRIPPREEPGGLQYMRSQESDTTERLSLHFKIENYKYNDKDRMKTL